MKSRELTNSKQFISYFIAISIGLSLVFGLVGAQLFGNLLTKSDTSIKIIVYIISGLLGFAITYVSMKLTFKRYILKKEDVNKAIFILGLLMFLVYGYLILGQYLSYTYLEKGINNYTRVLINSIFAILNVLFARKLMIDSAE